MRARSLSYLLSELAWRSRVYGTTRPQVWLQRAKPPDFAALSDVPEEAGVPFLDRVEVDETSLTPDQRAWRRDGVVVKPGLIPPDLVDAYCRVREAYPDPRGWRCPTPYMHLPEIRAICLHPPLMALLRSLLGEEMFLHLNLTGWISTERNWHQDDYLNPPFVVGWYVAVWFALDDIHPDSGPFEYVPGSHRWPLLRRERVLASLTRREREIRDRKSGAHYWPMLAERVTTPAITAKIRGEGHEVRSFLGRKGDVLVWHARLMHRGSPPRSTRLLRKALIGHYSAVGHRPDMPELVADAHGNRYARFDIPLV